MEEASEKNVADSSSRLTHARDILSAPIMSLRILSLWGPSNDRDVSESGKVCRLTYEAYTVAAASLVSVFGISCAANLKNGLRDIRELTDTLMIFTVTIHTLAKMWPLLVQRRLVLRCLVRLDALVRGWGLAEDASATPPQRRDAQRGCRRLVTGHTVVGFGMCTTTVVLWLSIPFFPDSGEQGQAIPCKHNASVVCSLGRDLRLPVAAWYPHDVSHARAPSQYWTTYAFQFISTFFNAMNTCACNSLYFGLMHCAYACLRSLRAGLRSLPAGDADGLRDLVRRHQMALKYIEDLSAMLGPMMFVHSCGVSLMLCAAVIHLVTASSLTVKFGAVMMFVIFEIGELFMYCLMGTEIQIQSVACGQDAYCAPWYESPVAMRRNLRLLLMRAQKPARIRGFGYTTLSLELFMSLLRLSYSYYAVLRQMEA